MNRGTMAGYQSQNRQVIKNAFKRLRQSEYDTVKAGAIAVAEAGLQYVIDAHEGSPYMMHHLEEKDTMAYAVAYDGVIVAAKSHEGGDSDLPGSAMGTAKSIVSQSHGWVIIVLSDMAGWYRADWEVNFLNYSADEIRANFHKFFKPVKR